MSRHLLPLLCVLSLTAVACTSADEVATPASTTSTTQATTTTTAATTTTTAAPEEPPADQVTDEPNDPTGSGLDGSIGEAADLVLSWFDGAEVTEPEYEAAFDDNFRAAFSLGDFTPIVDQLSADAPYTVTEILGTSDTEAQLLIVGTETAVPLVLTIAITGPDDPTMTTLFVAPQQPVAEPDDVDEAISRLEAQGTLRLGIFEGECASPIVDVAANDQAPLGSAFKLWVLAAVVDAVDAGTVRWDDTVTVSDELDSIPSGITQDDPAGTELTVRELAERMIEISDNTATDHLVDLVGREAVEQAFIDSGHSQPDRNRPLITTREFTIVKFGDDDLRARYLSADETERRRILDEEVEELELPPVTDIVTVTEPIDVESLEWFGSPGDLCRVLTRLASDDEAFDVLTRNPGVPDGDSRWASIAFKGGSEPGVLAMAWLVERADGSTRVVAGSISNEDRLLDEREAVVLFGYLRDGID